MGQAEETSGATVVQFTQSGELLRNVMDHAAVGMGRPFWGYGVRVPGPPRGEGLNDIIIK